MINIINKRETNEISVKAMKVGEVILITKGIYKDRLLLKSYNQYILLNDLSISWTHEDVMGILVDIDIIVK